MKVLSKTALQGAVIGAAIGYIVLHPISMLIVSNTMPGEMPGMVMGHGVAAVFIEALMAHHPAMGLYFSFLGASMGLLFGAFQEGIRKRDLETLEFTRRTNEFMEALFNASNDIMCVIDPADFSVKKVNDMFCRSMNLTQDQVLGKTCHSVTHHIDTPCRPPHDFCPMMETAKTLQPCRAEHIHFAPDGRKIFVEITTTTIPQGPGLPNLVLHVSRDVTAKKEAEEALEKSRKEMEEAHRLLEAADKRNKQELQVAHTVQKNLLPASLPTLSRFSLGVAFQPCYTIGGDFYEVIKGASEDKIGIFFGDVSGHGVAGAMLMALCKGLVNVAFRENSDPKVALRWLNRRLNDDFLDGYFISAFIALIDDTQGHLSFHNASPEAALLLRPDGEIHRLTEEGQPLGLFADDDDAGNDRLSFQALPMSIGETLILFTDGLSELSNKAGVRGGLDQVMKWIKTCAGQEPQTLTHSVLELARKERDGQDFEDDIMILAVKKTR